MVIALLAAFASAPAAGAGKDAACAALLAPAPIPSGPARDVTPADLVTLRDFGPQEASPGGEPPFSVSPDGKQAAFVLRRAMPESDSYCISVMVVPLDGGPARLADVGGEPILEVSDLRGLADLPIGNLAAVTPSWSPDGRWLAYLRRDAGRTRAWRARADGSGAAPVSRLDVDVRSVRWAADGKLVVTSRPGIAAAQKAIAAEGRQGFLFDRRFWPLSIAHPLPSASIPDLAQTIRADDGAQIPQAAPAKAQGDPRPAGALLVARADQGDLAWTAPADPRVVLGKARLHARRGGKTFLCRAALCAQDVAAFWWQSGALLFLQAGTAANGGITRLGRWRPGSGADPETILSTTDALLGCQPAGQAIVCARETATHPRTIVRIDPASGAITTLFDPNPEWALLRKGSVRRLSWRTADGAHSYGDLVLPRDHRPGERHPLIIVQYRSRGFLRGGTGDEYPIFALTARGYAVLSVERAPFVAAGRARSIAEFTRIGARDFAERRRQLSSIEAGVRQAIGLGLVDRSRIGITGLSDGAATVQFALVNSHLFSAAAVSSCCDGASSIHFAADRGYSDLLIAAGFPGPGEDQADFWKHYSLAANARRLRVPILMQLTEDEFRFGLETFVTLDHFKVPVEMYVFPGAYHQKWRPAQRLASYQRAIDWFDFWLNDKVDADPAKRAQYARWSALRARQPRAARR